MIFNVLIVDDEPMIIRALARVLCDDKINVIPCSSVKDALAILEKQPVCLAIVDIMLTDKDPHHAENGIWLIEHLKSTTDMPVLAISGYTEHLIEATHAGADESIRKPYDPTATNLLVNHYLKMCMERKKLQQTC